MSMERDPFVQQLFDIAKCELPGEAFIAGIMSEIDALRRRSIIAWAAAGVVLAIAAWLLTPTMVAAVGVLSQALPQSLVDVDEPSAFVSQMLSPLNSVAAVAAVTVMAIVYAYRKIF
jgi:hypothetical protein